MFERMRRHPLLISFLLLLLAAIGAFAVFLSTFDLNSYRAQLEQTLETALHRPVRFGEIHFSLRHGPGLDVSAAEIGDERLLLQVDHLILRLRVTPLFSRQLVFSDIYLDQPRIRILAEAIPAPGEAPQPAPERVRTAIDLLRRMRVESLTMRSAALTVIDRRSGAERTWGVNQVDLKLRNLALSGPVSLTAEGEIRVGTAATPWQLTGIITPPGADAPWQQTRVKLDLIVKGLRPETLTPLLIKTEQAALRLNGSCDLTLRGDGTPATGLDFQIQAKGQQFALEARDFFARPLRVREAVLAGTWQAGTLNRITDLLVRIDDVRLLGEITLPTTADLPREAHFTFPETPLSVLSRFIPDRKLPAFAATLRRNETAGQVKIDNIHLSWPKGGSVNVVTARARLLDGRFRDQRLGLVEAVNVELLWENQALELKAARARLLGGQTGCQGTIAFPAAGEPQLNLTLNSEVEAAALLPLLPAPWQQHLQLAGRINLSATVGGSRSRLLLDTVTRFPDASVAFNGKQLKGVGQPGELLLLGAATSTEAELSHAHLLLPFAEFRGTGRLALDESGGYDLACDVTHLTLESLPPFLDVQQELAPRGEVDLHVELSGDRNGLVSLDGNGQIRKLGLHLWNAVADIRGGTGRFTLTRTGLALDSVAALVGYSPVRATAELEWLPDFNLTLNVELPKVRASDLVFKSTKLYLTDVAGQLVIDTHGILFNNLRARIGEGTAVLVKGRLTGYEHPDLALDIEAPRADVDDVIALWQDGEKKQRNTPPEHTESPITVRIEADIAGGDLYGMRFHEARGTIAVREGRLTIAPVQLNIGAGKATVQIATGRLADEHPLLTVSGRVTKVDADAVYNQMLKRPGLLTGTLTGDFQLEGALGNYLPTSNGAFTFTLKRGVMRGFASLGRVFSLLSVSNILTLRLPDMNSEGFPYDAVSGLLTLKNGVLATDDLKVDSPALDMAAVGSYDLVKDRLDLVLGVKPLRTVDKILSKIPLAGWVLTGKEKALVTAQFRITGRSQDPQVEAIPISSLSDMVVGIFKRAFGLPGKVVGDVKDLFK